MKQPGEAPPESDEITRANIRAIGVLMMQVSRDVLLFTLALILGDALLLLVLRNW